LTDVTERIRVSTRPKAKILIEFAERTGRTHANGKSF
jgi:hypothetical protein